MSLRKVQIDNPDTQLCKLTIDEDMTIYTIAELKSDISKEISAYENFELSLSAVEEIDSAGIQFLLALKHELEKKKKQLQLTEISESVAKLMQCYGVSEFFHTKGTV